MGVFGEISKLQEDYACCQGGCCKCHGQADKSSGRWRGSGCALGSPEPFGCRTPRIRSVPQRIGVFGGTFDPPHRGHLAVAQAARRTLGLDHVVLVVANDPWKKSPERNVTPAADRLALVRALVEGEAGLVVSDIEIRRGGPSYTVVTLRELTAAHPGAELFLIIGRDLVDDFASWHESTAIGHLATIVVVDRPGYVTDARRDWKVLMVPPMEVSSTELRDHLRLGDDVSSDIPAAVLVEIRRRSLYGVAVSTT